MDNFADRLIAAIRQRGNPCVVGLDYHPNLAPAFVTDALKQDPTPTGFRAVLGGFFARIIDAVAPLVPAIKPQIALLEPLTWVGAQVFLDVVSVAKQRGLVVIADVKRGDISSSAQGYADAYLGLPEGPAFARGYDADAMTVNAFLGRDTLEPFLEACRQRGKGIFVLVKTSNKGSTETQDALLSNTESPSYSTYASIVAEAGASLVGESGYSPVGAVVGATFPDQARKLRALMPNTIILVPGYGAQGASADDVAVSFNDDGLGAIVNASRSITAQYGDPNISPKKYSAAVRDNVLRMIDDITAAVDRRAGR